MSATTSQTEMSHNRPMDSFSLIDDDTTSDDTAAMLMERSSLPYPMLYLFSLGFVGLIMGGFIVYAHKLSEAWCNQKNL